MKAFLVADDLDSDGFTSAVIATVEHLTKGALAQGVYDLIAISQVVVIDDQIVASLVVVPKVVRRFVRVRGLLLAIRANIIHRWEIQNFLPLVIRQLMTLAALEDSYQKSMRNEKRFRSEELTSRS